MAMAGIAHRRLLEVFGGESGCLRFSRDFYARVAVSPELKAVFPGKSLRCATEEFAAFLVQFSDGDPDQTQYRWWLSLRESHARFKISERQRMAWLRQMEATIDASIEDPAARLGLKNFFLGASAYIVGNEDVEIEDANLKCRWKRQQALDRVIADMSHGRDREAISLARQFASRSDVFVGILARMMEASREPLTEFVLESVQADSNLGNGRFNGRTLLHFAASSGCLPVVVCLLDAGINPDVLDGGNHTPLYRVAGSRREQGAVIASLLVRAGAEVDHCGGVSRSTALHEAARHGNMGVAEALLGAGANTLARDKKGFTPLDRARNCRRHDVAALLASR